jgi:hypothetical protein
VTDRHFVLILGDEEVEITRAEAYALEGSGYLIPARSTEEIWRFRPAPRYDADEVRYQLNEFRRPR